MSHDNVLWAACISTHLILRQSSGVVLLSPPFYGRGSRSMEKVSPSCQRPHRQERQSPRPSTIVCLYFKGTVSSFFMEVMSSPRTRHLSISVLAVRTNACRFWSSPGLRMGRECVAMLRQAQMHGSHGSPAGPPKTDFRSYKH